MSGSPAKVVEPQQEEAPPMTAREAGRGEMTPRALAAAAIIALIIGASYPYMVLKLGFGPNISVVAAFFGYLLMVVVLRMKSFSRWENNIVQAAGTSAGQTAFMCVVLAAFDLLNRNLTPDKQIHLERWQIFAWLLVAGLMGVLMAVPMRRHFIEEAKLPYPDGIAAAETILVLDAGGADARARARALSWGTIAALIATWFRDGHPRLVKLLDAKGVISKALAEKLDWLLTIPEASFFGALGARFHAQPLQFGLSWSLLSVGSGMLVGLRVNLSIALGMVVSWLVLPSLLHDAGVTSAITYKETLRWVMWPAVGMMVSGGLTALALKWRMLARTFKSLTASHVGGDDLSMRWVGGGLAVLTVALVLVQKVSLGISAWQTLVAVLLSIPLMLVSLRVLGETNWGPISTMGNMMQAIFALIAPGHMTANMTASGMTGSIAAGSEGLIQNYKTGQMIGSSNRLLTYAQLLAIPIGAAAVTIVYPMLAARYGVGGDHGGLSAPTAVKWAGFAEILSKGWDALPRGCFTAFLVTFVLGIVLTLLEQRWKEIIPSPSAVGLGMLLPGAATLMMTVGGVIEWAWRKRAPKSGEALIAPLSSGFIAGEAICAVVIPILITLGLLAE
jgi:uncharacterized oligopeptide transporter (OPT) family protein